MGKETVVPRTARTDTVGDCAEERREGDRDADADADDGALLGSGSSATAETPVRVGKRGPVGDAAQLHIALLTSASLLR